MLTTIRIFSVSLCVLSLSSCMLNEQSSTNDYVPYGYQNSDLYPEGYENVSTYNEPTVKQTNVVVPDSYHVGAYHSPASPKDRDRNWVSQQNRRGYTIEIANGEKAAHVAGALQKVPKSDRMAEVKYQSGGKAYYKGLYGSYDSQEAAQQALSALPDEVKQGAGVKTWESVQNNLSE
ncbi:MAG TPA: SPOR domain-containing protein [Legionella sp.]|nr:SPOR domain-containing protein [Legionella sp.]